MKNQLVLLLILTLIAVSISALNIDSEIDWSAAGPTAPTTPPVTSGASALFTVWIKSPVGKGLEFRQDKEITFEGESIGEVAKWTWDFGDGTTATGQKVTHKFSAKGEKKVVLTGKAEDTALGQDSDELTIKIVEEPSRPTIDKECKECSTILQCLACIDQKFVAGVFKSK